MTTANSPAARTAARGRTLPDRVVEAVRARPILVDAALAVLVVLVGLAEARSTHNVRALQDRSTVAVLVVSAPIVLRRRFPLPAAIATAVLATVAVLAVNGVGIELAALVMAYSVIVYGPRWVGPVAAAVLAVGALLPGLAVVVREGTITHAGTMLCLTIIAVLVASCTWLAGALRRAQRRSVEQLRERNRLLEQGRRQEVRLELLAERARLSREVHDVVAHSLSGIIAQADGGRYVASTDPDRAGEVLSGIAATGRQALDEVRGLLEMLRDTPDTHDPRADPDPDAPQPGVDDIAVLVEQVRAGGLPVELDVTGTPRPLPGGPALTAYRSVQEALTNVVKHAGPGTPTHVGLGWHDDELTVLVRDEGPRGPRPGLPSGGFGLAGMRERAALHGGTVETGPAGSGYAVRVRLPYPAGA